MIEVLFRKAWDALAEQRRNLKVRFSEAIARVRSRPIGIALTIGTPLLVYSWHLAALAERPPHLGRIVDELRSVRTFFGDPVPNNAGTCVLFTEETENGYGLYLYDDSNHQRKLLYEQNLNGIDYLPPSDTCPCWAPDDKFFSYAHPDGDFEIEICDGGTGASIAKVAVGHQVNSAVWLSDHTIVIADNNILASVQWTDGRWALPKPFMYFKDPAHKISRLCDGKMQNLTAWGADSVVWQQGNAIWSCSENSDEPVKIWSSATITLLEFSFSQSTGKFLLHCQDASGQFLADFEPDHPDQVVKIKSIDTNESDSDILGTEYVGPGRSSFVNNGKGYAYLDLRAGSSDSLTVKVDDSHKETNIEWPDNIKGIAMGNSEVFAIDDATGLWEYDIASGDRRCLVPGAEKTFTWAKNAQYRRIIATNAFGEAVPYNLLLPTNSGSGKKHPVVMCLGGIKLFWHENPESFANIGAYFVSVDESQGTQDDWASDVVTVYKSLSQNPEIDTNNLYLYGVSRGASAVNDVLESDAKLWRGVVLLSPVWLLDPSQMQIPGRFFIDCGGDDPHLSEADAQRFQDKAARTGTQVTLLVYPGLKHVVFKPSVLTEQMRESLVFVAETANE